MKTWCDATTLTREMDFEKKKRHNSENITSRMSPLVLQLHLNLQSFELLPFWVMGSTVVSAPKQQFSNYNN